MVETLKFEDQKTSEEAKFPIKRVCSGCQKELPGIAGYSNREGEVSHGLCYDCIRKLYPEDAEHVIKELEKEKDEKEVAA